MRHGLAGLFSVLPSEDQSQFDAVLNGLHEEHQPFTMTEHMLVEKMAQHFWLSQRAQRLADYSMDTDREAIDHEKQFALFMRYQTLHDRAFHKCLDQLLKLRAEKRKSRIGFESQKRKEAEEARKKELDQARVRLTNAKAADQELDTDIRAMIQAPLPGNVKIPFDLLKTVFSQALQDVASEPRA